LLCFNSNVLTAGGNKTFRIILKKCYFFQI